MQLQEDIPVCKVGKILSNECEVTETTSETITVYMSEDAHEEMLLPQESEEETDSADSVGCVKEENVYYVGLPVASMARASDECCLNWCTNGGNHKGKYFRYNTVDQMCWCLDVVVSRNFDPNYTSGKTMCGSCTNFPATPQIMNEGQNCYQVCSKQKGPCGWCGTQGLCCKKGHPKHGCDGNMGGTDDSKCVRRISYTSSLSTHDENCFTEDGVKYSGKVSASEECPDRKDIAQETNRIAQ